MYVYGSLSENVVVLFNKYYYKSYMSQSLWVGVSDNGESTARTTLPAKAAASLSLKESQYQAKSPRDSYPHSIASHLKHLRVPNCWHNAKTQAKLWLTG